MNALSRSTAIELLSQIVEKKDSFEETTSLKTVSLSSLFDSELEEMFIDSLKHPRIGLKPPELSSKTVNGRPGYSFKVGERQWDIEIHANVGEREGVAVPSEVDFLFKRWGIMRVCYHLQYLLMDMLTMQILTVANIGWVRIFLREWRWLNR